MDRVLAAAEHLLLGGQVTPTASAASERIYVAGPQRVAAVRRVRQRAADPGGQRRAVRRDHGADRQRHRRARRVVVLGAVVPEGGRVTGKDVSAWVELRAADGSWKTLPTEAFMSDHASGRPEVARDQHPDVTGRSSRRPTRSRRRPTRGSRATPTSRSARPPARRRPRRTRRASSRPPRVGRHGGDLRRSSRCCSPHCCWPPLVGLKAWRRHRRRSAGSASARFVGRLARARRPRARPRPARAAGGRRSPGASSRPASCPCEAGTLARRADSFVFGPSTPEVAAAATYWDSVDAERRAMSQEVGRWQRFRAATSLRSLRRTTSRSARDADRQPVTDDTEPTPAPGRVPAGRDGCAGSLIGVLDVRLTKLVRRPNVGCVSWRLAAARGTRVTSQTFARVPGKRLPGPPHEVHRPPACRCRAVPGPR